MNQNYSTWALLFKGLVVVIGLTSSLSVWADAAAAQKHFAQAQQKQNMGDARSAELLYAQALQDSPNDLAISTALTQFYIGQQRYSDAEALIAKDMQQHPSDFRVWKSQGVLAQARGDNQKAIDAYEKAFTLGASEDAYVLDNLRRHYDANGNAARRQQMDNDLKWLEINGSRRPKHN